MLALASTLRESGRTAEVVLHGGSMTPALADGARIKLELHEGVDYRPGAVVAFLRDGTIVVHRVIRRRRDGGWLLTRGDVNVVPDAPVAVSRVLGEVSGRNVGGTWTSVPDAPRRSASGRLARAAVRLVASAALEVRPALADIIVMRLQAFEIRRRRAGRR